MPDEQQRDQSRSAGQPRIWLVHSRGQHDDRVTAFWERIDAEAYAEARGAANPGQPSVLSQLVGAVAVGSVASPSCSTIHPTRSPGDTQTTPTTPAITQPGREPTGLDDEARVRVLCQLKDGRESRLLRNIERRSIQNQFVNGSVGTWDLTSERDESIVGSD